jgi:hypothetical protein
MEMVNVNKGNGAGGKNTNHYGKVQFNIQILGFIRIISIY